MRNNMKPLVLALTGVFAVCAIIAGILFATNVLPDIQGYGSNSQPYIDAWSLPFSTGQGVSIDVLAADVIIQAHDGQTVEARFEGARSPDSRGEMPYIEATSEGNRVVLRERRGADQAVFNIGIFSGGGILRGTLTIFIPRAVGDFYAETFSGGITASDIGAANIRVGTSSGNISLTNVAASYDLSVETFSGAQTLSGMNGRNVTLNTSGGGIGAASIKAASLNMESFSGAVEISDAAVEGEAKLTSSSGGISLAVFSAESLRAELFSGKLSLNGVQTMKEGALSTSNGAITGQNVNIQNLTFNTFSGSVNIDGLTSGSITGETSSGNVDLKLNDGGSAQINTFSGRVALTLPPNTGYSYTLDTFSGGIEVNDGGAGNIVTERSKDSMRGTVGSGGNDINIETSSGGISIMAG